MSKPEIIEVADVKPKKRVVVTGFAGPGFVSNTALMTVVNSKKFKQVAYLRGKTPPLMVLLNGKPEHCFRFYIDPSDELIFVLSEAVINDESAWELSAPVMNWLYEKGVSEIIALESFPSGSASANLMGFTTGKKVLTSYGINPVAQGAISGLHATLLEGALTRNIPWTNVFVPSPVAGGIDYTGVISVINLLNKMYGLNVDTTHLKKLSDDIQKRFTQEGAKRGGMFDTY